MAQTHPSITDDLRSFIQRQPVFFVATAPLSPTGHVNLSPKGLDSLRVLAPDKLAYLDLTGSGNETSAHLLENGRITFMFCAFEGKPKILRLYGQGRAILPTHPDYPTLSPLFPHHPGTRQLILADITRVQTSCGFGVPEMTFAAHRDLLPKWAAAKGDAGLADYRKKKNTRSIDGLPTPLSTEPQ